MAISTKKLMTGIQGQLDGQVVGYALAIYKSGELKRSTSAGWAVINERKFDSRVRASMASMGKTISAAAIVNALKVRGLSVDEPICNTLDWKFSPSAQQLTYRMVLTHTTGFPKNQGTTTEDLQTRLAGPMPALPAKHVYSNANFDLTRYLLPELVLPEFIESLLPPGPAHIEIVKKTVWEPAGLTGVDVVYRGPEPRTRYYYDSSDLTKYHTSNTLEEANKFVGAGWWTTSVREWGKLIDRMRHDVVLPGVWATMRDTAAASPDQNCRLGMYHNPTYDSYDHNGGVDGHFSAWVAFPEGITVVAVANSNYTKGMQEVIYDAYAQAAV